MVNTNFMKNLAKDLLNIYISIFIIRFEALIINIKINRVLISVIKTIDGIMNHFFIKAIMNC
ncbi:hypothetical protein BS623_00665 [Vibrio parahaemolyticus]|nr:hypothetical protein BS623_00665 [Vibrio parahaemolyticus]OUJ47414.1 hypothetical protein BTZ53_03570 [Vibrio parahaemolyticus]QHG97014.1 hypothetical protein EHC70_23100 [Vibrio parahaemolyticus]QHH02161.1 hypothetical protein EHC64_24195 [Vibrio parahaemolyticus]QHH07276.1 hypothetical protein EHC66_23830 [Vibrio parahaemolyticus]